MLLFSQALFPMFYYQGNDKIAWFSTINVFAKGSYLLSLLLFINTPKDATYVNFLLGFTALIVYIVSWILIYKKEQIKWIWVSVHNIKKRFTVRISYVLLFLIVYVLLNSVSHEEDSSNVYSAIMFAFPSLFVSMMFTGILSVPLSSFSDGVDFFFELILEYKPYSFIVIALIFGLLIYAR